ncbi:sugar phosphate isomerase/epimerase [Candidatus Poribacteria bacterium]|nr:sugar phosphate isomerase/epimerase [Candidatus Poribacteria bacterium]
MYASIRDGTALSAGFASIREAAEACEIHAFELDLTPDMRAPSAVSPDQFTLDSDQALTRYKCHLAENGLRPAGFLLASDFSSSERDRVVDWVIQAARAANAVGMAAIRVDSAMRREREMATPERIDLFVECLSQAVEATSDLTVGFGIENHGAGGNNREFLDGVFAGVGSDRVGMTMDMGNFYWSGMPLSEVYQTLEHFASRTKHTHVKNINYPASEREKRRPIGWEYGKYACPIEEGDIDLRRVIGFLRAAGYTGDLSLEDESIGRFPPEERKAVLIRDAQYLRSLL